MVLKPAADNPWTGFSIEERDRRWDAVRANAAGEGLDGVLIPPTLDRSSFHLSLEQARGNQADCRYLTQVPNGAFILPTDGRDPILITDRGQRNPWIKESRPVSRSGDRGTAVPAIVEALKERGMERARIGVAPLKQGTVTHGRALQGAINYSSLAEVEQQLPNATFVDATDVIGFARFVKSEEEIATLTYGAEIALAGIEAMRETARPGVPEAVVYAKVMRRMMELGSEYYPLAINTAELDQPNYRHENPLLGWRLGPNWKIENEVDAVWGGMVAQEMQPMLLGPVPEHYRPVIDLQRECYYAALERMKPGFTLGEFADFVSSYGDARGKLSITMHGRGFGDDGPMVMGTDLPSRVRNTPLQKGNVFVFKPGATSDDGRARFAWGGCVQVTDRGGALLVDRAIDLISIQ
jgi:Xaa-Pro aminopeptidase